MLRYKPPQSEIEAGTHARARFFNPRWIAVILAGLCFLSGVVRIAGLAIASARGNLSILTLYVLCVDPILWCVLGFLFYTRSKHALAGAVAAVVVPFLLLPWGTLLLQSQLGGGGLYFDYWSEVSARINSMGMANAVVYVVVLAFAAWDLRGRSLPEDVGDGEPLPAGDED